MKRVAFYGGSFDPVHNGHLAVGEAVSRLFAIDQFVYLPAFHAPHKKRLVPTPAIDRYTMLCLATMQESLCVSKLELEMPARPYTIDTLGRLKELYSGDEIFFVMGADSWLDITTWREWEQVLMLANHIVVTRPGYEIGTDHVTSKERSLIIDARGREAIESDASRTSIYFTDAINTDISATLIRSRIRGEDSSWMSDVPEAVANYIEKYQIYS
jgi:nicotinate-nucleotide adenylyltransferase